MRLELAFMNKAILNALVLCLLGLGTCYASYAQEAPSLREDRPDSYTVVTGDTLWDISGRFLEDPWRWREIWQGNSHIANPDLIYPGDVIRLLFVDGKPQLVVQSALGTTSPETPASNNTAQPSNRSEPGTPDNNGPLKTIKLSPKVHTTPLKTAIESIPLETINKFLLRNRVVEPDTLSSAAHVIAGQEKRVILSAGDRIYARGDFSGSLTNYGIYRKGQDYFDPITKEILGVQAVDVGGANLRAISNDVATFGVSRSTSEIRIGNRLLPIEERKINSTFFPSPPDEPVEGVIMNVETGVSQAGRLDIIAINLGKRDNMQQGHLLGIFKDGGKIRDRNAKKKTPRTVELPDERAGLIMVFQVFEKMSLAIVLEAERGVVIRDHVSNP